MKNVLFSLTFVDGKYCGTYERQNEDYGTRIFEFRR